jgi:hypothetical protein
MAVGRLRGAHSRTLAFRTGADAPALCKAGRFRPETGQKSLEKSPYTPTKAVGDDNLATCIDPAREVSNIRARTLGQKAEVAAMRGDSIRPIWGVATKTFMGGDIVRGSRLALVRISARRKVLLGLRDKRE